METSQLVIATQLHIHHLMRELQLVYFSSLLDLLDGHLDVRHAIFVKSITSLMVLFLKTSIAFCNVLLTSSSSGDFPLSFMTSKTFRVTESFLQPAVTPFQRQLSPTRAFITSFSTLITRIGFSDASFSIARTIKPLPMGTHTFPLACGWLCSFLSWVLGSHPWLFFFIYLGPVPGCFSFFKSILHVFHQTFCSPWVSHRRF